MLRVRRGGRCRSESAPTVLDGLMWAIVSRWAALTGPILGTARSRLNTWRWRGNRCRRWRGSPRADVALPQILFEFRPQASNLVRLPERDHPALGRAGRGDRQKRPPLGFRAGTNGRAPGLVLQPWNLRTTRRPRGPDSSIRRQDSHRTFHWYLRGAHRSELRSVLLLRRTAGDRNSPASRPTPRSGRLSRSRPDRSRSITAWPTRS